MTNLHRQRFFDKQVHMDEWKESMAGENEKKVLDLICGIGYVCDKDFCRQYPVGKSMVVDFAFPKLQFAIEVDGVNHKGKKAKEVDRKKDAYLLDHGWVVLRMKEEELFGYKMSFYKSLIVEVVNERQLEYESGKIDTRDYKEGYQDY